MKREAERKRAVNLTTEQIGTAKELAEIYGLNNMEIAKILKCSATTISKYRTYGFNMEAYRNAKRELNKRARAKQAESQAEEQLPGQLKMELTSEGIKVEPSDQTKLMRFQAGQVEKLIMEIDKLNDTLGQILRAVRKE